MKTTFIFLLIILMASTALYAQSGTSLVLGGGTAYTRGPDANYWNPANLALYHPKMPAFRIMLWSVNTNFWNNSLDRSLYDDYFGTGQTEHIDESEKEEILGKISSEGIKMEGNFNASVLSMTYKNFGFSVQAGGYGHSTVPKDIIELILKGNSGKQSYDVSIDGKGVGYGKAKFSYGRIIARDKKMTLPGNRQVNLSKISLGASASYIYGGGIIDVLESQAVLTNQAGGFDMNSNFRSRESVGGSGFGLDLGTSIVTDNNWMAGLYFDNLLNSISWSTDTQERRYGINLDGPKPIVNGFDSDTGLLGLDEEDVKTDTTLDISNFSTSLPIDFRFGIAKDTRKYLANFELGTQNSDFFIGFGGQYKLNWFKVHVGYRYLSESQFSMGFALDFAHFYLDFALRQIGSLSSSGMKGFGAGTAFGFAF